MKFLQTSAALVVAAAVMVQDASAACSTPAWGQCGKSDGSTTCCPDGFYCQPWDSGNVQCQQVPAKCENIVTNVDFPGNDIKTVYGVQPGDCCTACSNTKDCNAYTFINHRAGPTACYLKRAGGKEVRLVGAISGYIKGGKKASKAMFKDAGKCATNPWGKCGDEKGAACCPSGQYCQPWNPGFYQCVQVPSKCPTQLTDTDFPGNDIGKARAGTGEECCNACAANKNCKAYTFVNFNNDGPQCYLKSSAGNGKGTRKVGAVSGKL